jgi:hypothetical protein
MDQQSFDASVGHRLQTVASVGEPLHHCPVAFRGEAGDVMDSENGRGRTRVASAPTSARRTPAELRVCKNGFTDLVPG